MANNLSNLFQQFSLSISRNLNKCLPGVFESYDYTTQKATVIIGIKEQDSLGQTINGVKIVGVPVIFTQSGGASITMPIKTGDTCLLLFSDRDLSDWLHSTSSEINTASSRMHSITDAIAITGLNKFTKTSPSENNADLLIKHEESVIRIKPGGFVDIECDETLTTKVKNIENIVTKLIDQRCENLEMQIEKLAKIVSGKDIYITSTEGTININSESAKVIINGKNNVEVNAGGDITFIATGNIDLKATGNINLKAEGNNTITTTGNLDIKTTGITNMSSTGATTISSSADVTVKSDATLNLQGKNVKITATDNFSVNADKATITAGDIKFDGKTETTGEAKFASNILLEGNLIADGNISADGDVTAGSVSLKDHGHSYSKAVSGASPSGPVTITNVPSSTSSPGGI